MDNVELYDLNPESGYFLYHYETGWHICALDKLQVAATPENRLAYFHVAPSIYKTVAVEDEKIEELKNQMKEQQE